MRIVVAKDLEEAKKLARQHRGKYVISIEAEWGDLALEEPNVDLSLNHHGPRSNNICPAEVGIKRPYLIDNFKDKDKAYIISHLDADTIFGIMWLEGYLNPKDDTAKKLSEIVAYSDKNGYHKAAIEYEHLKNTDIGRKWLTIGYLFSRNNKVKTGDITTIFKNIVDATKIIIESKDIASSVIYQEAYYWNSKKTKNAKDSLVFVNDDMLVFKGKHFYCDNYNLFNEPKKVIIQYNTNTNSVLLSAYDKDTAVDLFGKKGVAGMLQDFFGDEAGGHTAIGGSPRNKYISEKDFDNFVQYIEKVIKDRG